MFTWDQLYVSPSPDTIVPLTPSSSAYSGSPSFTMSSFGSSPSPSPAAGYTQLPPVAPQQISMDYTPVLSHLPALYQRFQSNLVATQILQSIEYQTTRGYSPDPSHIGQFVLEDGNGYRCAVGDCERHRRGKGWNRSDRAREHFLTTHLGAVYRCTVHGCPATCKRPNDLHKHVLGKHAPDYQGAPGFGCVHCGKSFPKKHNLNRHIESVHSMPTNRRIRGT